MKGLVFDTENQMQFKDFGEPLLDNLQKEVGGCIEVVHPKYLPEGLCMVIDDEGLLKGYAINNIASILYGTPEHGQPIVGTAVILREGFVAGELDFMSLDDGDEVGLIMATGKRYYWIKLKDSFMSSDMIDYLMGQPDGANYVVLYQMLCLKTINTGGRLAFQIGDMIIPYDVEKIQRECKWFSLATVRVALEVYKQIGLIYEDKDGVLVLANYSDIVGSETDYSAQKRLQRENRRRQLPPKCADSNEDNNVDNVHTEKEIEIDKEKDIENRERVRDNGSPTVDAGLAEIIRSFEDNLGGFPPAAREDLLGWREIFTDDLILLAIKKAALAGVRKWSYVNGILKVWKNEGVRTLGDVQSRDERRKPPAGQQPKRSAADDYDEIFGELLGGSTT